MSATVFPVVGMGLVLIGTMLALIALPGAGAPSPVPATSSAAAPRTRRHLISGALAGAAAATVLGAKPAKAELSFNDLRPIIRILENLFELSKEQLAFLQDIFRVISAFSLNAVYALINSVLDLLDGPETFMRSDRAAENILRSYPDEVLVTPRERAAQMLFRGASVKARAIRAVEVTSTIAEANGELANEEAAILETAQASGSVMGMLQGILALQAQTCARLGNIAFQNAAIAQQLADLCIVDADDRAMAIRTSTEFRDGLGDTISPPRELPTE